MFHNIGRKIKALAVIVCWFGIIGSFISGLLLIANDEDAIGVGLAIMIGGIFVSWLGSFFTYGFGELIDKVDQIEQDIKKGNSTFTQVKTPSTPFDELDKLRAEGLITEEEYRNAIAKKATMG